MSQNFIYKKLIYQYICIYIYLNLWGYRESKSIKKMDPGKNINFPPVSLEKRPFFFLSYVGVPKGHTSHTLLSLFSHSQKGLYNGSFVK